MRVRMPLQPSKTGDRLGIWGDSKVRFVYIQGDSSNIPPANLSCWNSGHTWPTELWFLSRLEVAGASRGFSKGKWKKRKKSGMPCTTPGQDPRVEFLKGLLFWIEEKSGIVGWNGCTGARGKVSIRASLVRLDTSPLGQIGIRGWSDSQESNCMVVTPR